MMIQWMENCDKLVNKYNQEHIQGFCGGEEGEDNKNIVLQITKQCVQNNANIAKLLTNRIRDLPHFAGDN